MHMGECIAIEEQVAPFEFICSGMATGTIFLARIDEDKRDLFSDQTWITAHPSACPFLRRANGCILCTIHEMSPVQCKAYRCTVLRIFSAGGSMIGTVTGTLALHTEDVELRAEWERARRSIVWSARDAEEQIARYFTEKGYRTI
jgi:Fe-S-cluster containining protein